MHRIALVNQKGGVGKTTTAVNLSACLAALGRRVLLIDLDPQANTSISFGVRADERQRTSYNLLRGDCTAAESLVTVRPNLDLIPANIDLAGAEVELAGTIGREFALRDSLRALTNYDYAIIDCPPSLGLLNVNALSFVTEVYIPLQCEYFALHGVSMLFKTVGVVKSRVNPALDIQGVIPCMYDARTGLSREVVTEIEKHFPGRVFKTRIRTNVRLAEAPSHGKSIIEYAPDSNGAQDYRALALEVMARHGERAPEEIGETPEEAAASSGAVASPAVAPPLHQPHPVVPTGTPAPAPEAAAAAAVSVSPAACGTVTATTATGGTPAAAESSSAQGDDWQVASLIPNPSRPESAHEA
ncbi:MAG: ParA family protein [Planctomycetes bacterium]|nr:ParA family protein [Planctomycetota bacterium]